MQETWNIKLGNAANLEEQIQQSIGDAKLELGIFLSYYFKKDGAVVENCALKGPILFTETNKGKFTLEFDLVHYNACLNIHVDQKDTMEIKFEIEDLSRELKLTGPYWPEREMDEL